MTRALLNLEIGEVNKMFDEAIILIDGHEEETIRIECEHAGDIADQLIRLVNNREQILKTLTAAAHALRSYEYGNASPDLARSIAEHCEQLFTQTGTAA